MAMRVSEQDSRSFFKPNLPDSRLSYRPPPSRSGGSSERSGLYPTVYSRNQQNLTPIDSDRVTSKRNTATGRRIERPQPIALAYGPHELNNLASSSDDISITDESPGQLMKRANLRLQCRFAWDSSV